MFFPKGVVLLVLLQLNLSGNLSSNLSKTVSIFCCNIICKKYVLAVIALEKNCGFSNELGSIVESINTLR